MTKRKYEGVKCEATNRSGKPCQRPAGWGTDHAGDGRCKLHGGAVQIKTGRYSVIKRKRIAELIEYFRQDPDPLNVNEELNLLRALVLDFIERYDEFTDALIAWHNSYGDAYDEAVEAWQEEYKTWREKMTEIYEANGWMDVEAEDLPRPPEPPDPLTHQNKPRQVLDVLSAGKFVVQIGTLVDRVEKAKQEGSVSLATLDAYLKNLGKEVFDAAREVIADDDVRTQLLDTLEAKWRVVPLRDTAAATGTQRGSRALN